MHYYQRIRDIREDRDLTQTEIGNILGIKYQQYARYENGERELPLHHAIALARYYDISLDYLVGLVQVPRTLNGTPYITHLIKKDRS